MKNTWWYRRQLRIYHPNAREFELKNLNTARFINDCVDTGAEAVVISAGGIYAFCQSKIKYHYISPIMGERDLLKEITDLAHENNLKVLARFDFSKAREDVFLQHPEWFQRKPNGEPYRSTKFFAACPIGGYHNADFAYRVILEAFRDYHVDGVHLNAGGFHRHYCYCDSCKSSFGRPIPFGPEEDAEAWRQFIRWRQEAIAKQLSAYYKLMTDVNPEAFFMAELAGEEYPAWTHDSGFQIPALRNAFSQILCTSGGLAAPKQSRWWIGMTADKVQAVDNTPVINIKLQMRDMGFTNTNVPPAEFLFYCYQSIAHGSGLKLATFGIPQYMSDERTMPCIKEVFELMKAQREVLDTMVPVCDTALVYPAAALLESMEMEKKAPAGARTEMKTIEGLRGEFVGLYNVLKAIHGMIGVIFDEDVSAETLAKYRTIVFPTVVWMDDKQSLAISDYVKGGGSVIVLDSITASDGSFYPIPKRLADLLNCKFESVAANSNYMITEASFCSEATGYIGPLPLTKLYRTIKTNDSVEVLVSSSFGNEPAAPEEFSGLTAGENPIVIRSKVGKGRMVYVGTGMGKMLLDIGHTDYYTMIGSLVNWCLHGHGTLTTDAPASMEVNLARWEKGLVVHLVNGSGMIPLDKPLRVGPVSIDIRSGNPDRVTLNRPGSSVEDLIFNYADGILKLEIPYVDLYAQVVIYQKWGR
jgi:hypothetical protein